MQYIIIAIFVLALYSCSANNNSPDNVIKDDISSTALKGKRLRIKESKGICLRFSFTDSHPAEGGTVYQVVSNYDNKNIGFDLAAPYDGGLKLIIRSTGDNSNNFLQVLQNLYLQETDSSLKFTDSIVADCLPMGGYMDRMNKGSSNNARIVEHKLFFQGKKKDEYAEFYLTINEKENWIELKETDPAFRPAFIKLLTKKMKRDKRNLKKAGTRELAPAKV